MQILQRKFALIIFLTVIGAGLAACQQTSPETKIPEEQEQREVAWVKNNNIYTSTLEYESPGGIEKNPITLTVENGVIRSVNVEVVTDIAASVEYQQNFAKEIGGKVIGKKLSELGEIDRVSGASLTTDAFNEAVKKLQQQ